MPLLFGHACTCNCTVSDVAWIRVCVHCGSDNLQMCVGIPVTVLLHCWQYEMPSTVWGYTPIDKTTSDGPWAMGTALHNASVETCIPRDCSRCPVSAHLRRARNLRTIMAFVCYFMLYPPYVTGNPASASLLEARWYSRLCGRRRTVAMPLLPADSYTK
jgi:hypothetical protein